MTSGWRHVDGTLSWGISPDGDLVELRADRRHYIVAVWVPNPHPEHPDWNLDHQVSGANNAIRLYYAYLGIDRKPPTLKDLINDHHRSDD